MAAWSQLESICGVHEEGTPLEAPLDSAPAAQDDGPAAAQLVNAALTQLASAGVSHDVLPVRAVSALKRLLSAGLQ